MGQQKNVDARWTQKSNASNFGYKKHTDLTSDPSSVTSLLKAGGATNIQAVAEAGSHGITCAEDWWTIVMGSGYRGTVEQLDPAIRDRVRQANIQQVRDAGIRLLEVSMVYAVAQKECS